MEYPVGVRVAGRVPEEAAHRSIGVAHHVERGLLRCGSRIVADMSASTSPIERRRTWASLRARSDPTSPVSPCESRS